MIDVRPCADEADERLSLEIYNTVWPREAASLDEVHAFAEAAQAYADYVAYLHAAPVGSLAVATFQRRPGTALALLTVLPQHRWQGAGTALYEEASRWAIEHSVSQLDAAVPEDDPESQGFAARRGFRVVEHNSTLVLDLARTAPPAVAPPPGIVLTTWAERPDLAEGIYAVAGEASLDVPSDRPPERLEDFDRWLEHEWRYPGTLAEGTMLALADDEVVGFARLTASAAQPGVAYHAMTGVKRGWRGRGIAGALKRAQVTWAKSAGYERLVTNNELRNEPMRRLNARLGYRIEPGRVIMRGPLASLASLKR